MDSGEKNEIDWQSRMRAADAHAAQVRNNIDKAEADQALRLRAAQSPAGRLIRNIRHNRTTAVGVIGVIGAIAVVAFMPKSANDEQTEHHDPGTASVQAAPSSVFEQTQITTEVIESRTTTEQPSSVPIPSVEVAIRKAYGVSTELFSCSNLLQRAGVLTASEQCTPAQEVALANSASAIEQAANKRTGVWFRNFPFGHEPVDRAAAALAACIKYERGASQSDVADFLSTGRYALSADSAAVLAGDSLQNICPQD